MIILISGAINTGKTTVGRRLAARLSHAAHVEVDALRDFVAALPLAEALPVTLENAAAVARNFARRGFDVVLTYPLGPDDHAYLVGQLCDLGAPIHAVTLGPPLAVALANRGGRALTEHERRRICEQYAAGRHRPPYGVVLDNGGQTADETVTAILRAIGHTVTP
jgi:NAD-dependent oxidoreductase involved in siderophore biosynthesis